MANGSTHSLRHQASLKGQQCLITYTLDKPGRVTHNRRLMKIPLVSFHIAHLYNITFYSQTCSIMCLLKWKQIFKNEGNLTQSPVDEPRSSKKIPFVNMGKGKREGNQRNDMDSIVQGLRAWALASSRSEGSNSVCHLLPMWLYQVTSPLSACLLF